MLHAQASRRLAGAYIITTANDLDVADTDLHALNKQIRCECFRNDRMDGQSRVEDKILLIVLTAVMLACQ